MAWLGLQSVFVNFDLVFVFTAEEQTKQVLNVCYNLPSRIWLATTRGVQQ